MTWALLTNQPAAGGDTFYVNYSGFGQIVMRGTGTLTLVYNDPACQDEDI